MWQLCKKKPIAQELDYKIFSGSNNCSPQISYLLSVCLLITISYLLSAVTDYILLTGGITYILFFSQVYLKNVFFSRLYIKERESKYDFCNPDLQCLERNRTNPQFFASL